MKLSNPDAFIVTQEGKDLIITLKETDATEEAVDERGYFHTGDVAQYDDEGYFYIVDRKKDMFISGGENVYPAEVEKVILQHPAVEETVVIGVAVSFFLHPSNATTSSALVNSFFIE